MMTNEPKVGIKLIMKIQSKQQKLVADKAPQLIINNTITLYMNAYNQLKL